jgi:hypothetical protein
MAGPVTRTVGLECLVRRGPFARPHAWEAPQLTVSA